MRPILFQIGRLTIYSWGAMVALGVLVGLFLARREGRRVGISPQKITDFAFYLLIAGLIFGRLVFILFDDPIFYFKKPLQILMIWQGGLAIHGALLGGLLAGYWFSRRQGISLGVLADLVTPSLILGQAIGRIGCFLAGSCYGRVTTLPLGINFFGMIGARHPTQLYQSFLNLLVFLIIWKWRPKKQFDGHLFLLYLILYSGARFVVEIFRDSQILAGPVTIAQAASIVIALGSYGIIRFKLKRASRETEAININKGS